MLVSHGMQVVKQLAERCLWLENGGCPMEGPGDEVVRRTYDWRQTDEDTTERQLRWRTSERSAGTM